MVEPEVVDEYSVVETAYPQSASTPLQLRHSILAHRASWVGLGRCCMNFTWLLQPSSGGARMRLGRLISRCRMWAISTASL